MTINNIKDKRLRKIGKKMSQEFNWGYETAKLEILKFIETERDNGNIIEVDEGNLFKTKMKGFSASLCLSKLMKMLREK